MKFVFIVNPIAGNDDKKEIFSRIRSAFRFIDDEMIVEETHKQGDARDISARYAQKYGKDCVVVSCGGDGTIHEIANGLAHTDTPLMVLPLGTGNDFAKKIYSTKKINVLNVIKSFGLYSGKIKYTVKPIDLISYNGEKCINVMSFGADTMVVKYGKKIAEKMSFLGHNAYTAAFVPVMVKEGIRYKISYDINCIDEQGNDYNLNCDNQDFTFWAICNASYYGGGYCPAPNSKLDDGLLDFVLLEGVSVPEALKLLPKYSAGALTEKDSPRLKMGYIKSGRIWTPDQSSLNCNCDGELLDCNEINFEVEHNALKVCFIKE